MKLLGKNPVSQKSAKKRYSSTQVEIKNFSSVEATTLNGVLFGLKWGQQLQNFEINKQSRRWILKGNEGRWCLPYLSEILSERSLPIRYDGHFRYKIEGLMFTDAGIWLLLGRLEELTHSSGSSPRLHNVTFGHLFLRPDTEYFQPQPFSHFPVQTSNVFY